MSDKGKKLQDLLADVEVVKTIRAEDVNVRGIAFNSQLVRPGFMFVAIPGAKADGHDYIVEAVKRGAAVVVAEREEAVGAEVAAVIVKACREALGAIAAAFYEDPSSRINVVGVTGTNGKTTVAYIVYELLRKAGFHPGLIGTIEYRIGERRIASQNTTPESLEVHRMLAELEAEGGRVMVMEVSSHALDQGRVDRVRFKVAVFTNLSRDHTDYHETMKAYRHAKMKLFDKVTGDGAAVLNIDDDLGAELARRERCCALTYSVEADAMLTVQDVQSSLSGSTFTWSWGEGSAAVNLPLVGRHNIYNFLAAAGAAMRLGVDPHMIAEAASGLAGVPGRLERIDEGQDFVVFVDYAHTDDALEKVLASLKQLEGGSIILVFGCGGDRDRTKRPAMAAVAGRMADFVVVTSDNPRSEEPPAIIEDIKAGFDSGANYVVEPDRRKAIARAVAEAGPGDIVLIAGKGHETYQVFSDGVTHFDDREEARNAIRAKLERK